MVILYDIENLQTKENISYVVKKFANNKKVSAQFAYANWSIFGKGVAEFLSAHDVKLRQVDSWDGLSGYLKNACDIALTTDAVEMLYENPNIEEYVIVSGDGGYIELIKKLHRRMKKVTIISVESYFNKSLGKHADIVELFQDQEDPTKEIVKLEYKQVVSNSIKEKSYSMAEKAIWAHLKNNKNSNNIVVVLENIFADSNVKKQLKDGLPLEYLTDAVTMAYRYDLERKTNMLKLIDSFAKYRYLLKDGLLHQKKE